MLVTKTNVKDIDFDDDNTQQLIETLQQQLAEKDSPLQRRDEQIDALTQALDHAQQLAAMSQKQAQALTEQLRTIEDLRQRPWWKSLFGR